MIVTLTHAQADTLAPRMCLRSSLGKHTLELVLVSQPQLRLVRDHARQHPAPIVHELRVHLRGIDVSQPVGGPWQHMLSVQAHTPTLSSKSAASPRMSCTPKRHSLQFASAAPRDRAKHT